MRIVVNGTTLYFDVEGSALVADGPVMRERPTIVLLHGGPGFDHSTFKPEFSRLAEFAQVVYLDHRGGGRSGGQNDPSRWTLEVWADDVRAFCDAIGIEHPIVLGWSFGGFVAAQYAIRHPDHPAKVVLQSTQVRWDLERSIEGFGREGGPRAADAERAFFTARTPETFAAFLQHCTPAYSPQPRDETPMQRAILNVELMDHFFADPDFDLTAGLKAVTCPVLVLAGTRDPITPLGAAEEIVASLPNADVTFEVFERSGHYIHETEPERYFATLERFVTA